MRSLITAAALCCAASLVCAQATRSAEGASRTDAFELQARAAQASRSDSIDILHTRIALDLTRVATNQIFGAATIRFAPKVAGIDHLPLDLLALTIDSVTTTGGTLGHAQSGETLDIDLGTTYGPTDTLELTVHYHGDPVVDGSGWGGFYTSGSVIYDLGVAFESQPHSFGRAWFPCFDNFVERSTYEFVVRTHLNRHAWCNGTLISEVSLGGDTLESHWVQDEAMPSYLASVTASTYVVARDTFPSIAGTNVPVDLVAQPGDTTAMKNSFAHLQDAFDTYEEWFGRHRWDRVGYCLTPQGAMEHPTNISYPTSIANGTLQYEATMAHELGHHWFGDQVTCARAEEMYINEGFAEYLSYLFLERVYGRDRYMDVVRDNHRDMVHNSHLLDEGWWALADMPQDWTYGTITYNKGADVLHALRSYLGDTLFSEGLTSFLDAYAFQSVNSLQLRDHLTSATGMDMTDFFDDWIFQPGWADFEVDSLEVNPIPIPGGYYLTTAFIEQKLRGPASYYHNVPLTITFIDALGNQWQHPLLEMVGDQFCTIGSAPPFIPVKALLNVDERISLAMTQDVDTLSSTGTVTYSHADFRVTVNALPTPMPIIIQEHWVAADDNVADAFAYVVSPDRWWRLSGVIPAGADLDGRIMVDGRPTANASYDIGLVQDAAGVAFHEDSLVVLYRPDAHFPWAELPDFTISTMGGATDGFARIDFIGLAIGDYTLGWRKSAVGIHKPRPVDHDGWFAYLGADSNITVEWRGNGKAPEGKFTVHDAGGRALAEQEMKGRGQQMIHASGWAVGEVLIEFTGTDGQLWNVGRIIMTRDR